MISLLSKDLGLFLILENLKIMPLTKHYEF